MKTFRFKLKLIEKKGLNYKQSNTHKNTHTNTKTPSLRSNKRN